MHHQSPLEKVSQFISSKSSPSKVTKRNVDVEEEHFITVILHILRILVSFRQTIPDSINNGIVYLEDDYKSEI